MRARSATTTPTSRRPSSPCRARRSAAGRPRSGATSWVSGCSGCPASPADKDRPWSQVPRSERRRPRRLVRSVTVPDDPYPAYCRISRDDHPLYPPLAATVGAVRFALTWRHAPATPRLSSASGCQPRRQTVPSVPMVLIMDPPLCHDGPALLVSRAFTPPGGGPRAPDPRPGGLAARRPRAERLDVWSWRRRSRRWSSPRCSVPPPDHERFRGGWSRTSSSTPTPSRGGKVPVLRQAVRVPAAS